MNVIIKERILPISTPFSTTYAVHSNSLAILGECSSAQNWLLNNFVQLVSWHKVCIDYLDFNTRDCPFINYQRMDKIFIESNWSNNIVEYIIDAINNGFYSSFCINTMYIPAYNSRKGYCHEIFVYGYSQPNQEFYIADNFQFGQYKFSKCSFDEMDKAYRNLTKIQEDSFTGAAQAKGAIQMINVRQNNDLSFSPNRFRDSMEDYISGSPPRGGFNNFEYKPHTYGCISSYKTVDEHLKDLLEKKSDSPPDVRKFHIMWEHKNIMLKRIVFMQQNNYLKDGDSVCEVYSQLAKQLMISRNLFLKYIINGDERILEDLIIKYKEYCESDIQNSNLLLEQLKTN